VESEAPAQEALVASLVQVEQAVPTSVVLVESLVPAGRTGVVELPAAPELVELVAKVQHAHRS
jgi:hypothetical protein